MFWEVANSIARIFLHGQHCGFDRMTDRPSTDRAAAHDIEEYAYEISDGGHRNIRASQSEQAPDPELLPALRAVRLNCVGETGHEKEEFRAEITNSRPSTKVGQPQVMRGVSWARLHRKPDTLGIGPNRS